MQWFTGSGTGAAPSEADRSAAEETTAMKVEGVSQEAEVVPEKEHAASSDEPSSLITRSDLHLVLLAVALGLALFDQRHELLYHIGGSALVLQGGFMLLQVPASTLGSHGLDPTAVRYLTSLACWVAVLLIVYCCGVCLGISSSRPSEQVILAATVAIGAGAQPVLANFSAGLLLILQRPYRVGDWITVGGSETFEVTSIHAFFTHGKSASAHAHVTLPNSQAVGATISNLSARSAQLFIVGVHVRSGLHPCATIRKAIAAAAVAYDAGVAGVLKHAGVVEDVALPKCSYYGPLVVGRQGMRWELRAEAPLKAQLHCTSLANECMHDALMAAGIKMHEDATTEDFM